MIQNDTIWNKVKQSLIKYGVPALPTLIPIAIKQLKLLLLK